MFLYYNDFINAYLYLVNKSHVWRFVFQIKHYDVCPNMSNIFKSIIEYLMSIRLIPGQTLF